MPTGKVVDEFARPLPELPEECECCDEREQRAKDKQAFALASRVKDRHDCTLRMSFRMVNAIDLDKA
jgi:hypothetical protein